ncbi:MAG TPA: polyprenol monophosphomannose synthase [Anaerolineae bacterium]|nr:polyprenol monophosphomannose synthase [Anaerolineae bacterium]HQK14939.1 polyprenol monophosphomannose synthase [Anaerolineae bacterium]
MPASAKKLTVVVPTYNEADNVRPMTEALLALELPNLDILFVDDASPDGTGAIADGLAAQYPGRVHVMHRTGARGLGRAYIDGFRWALAHGAEYIVQMDCDFSHSPTYIPQFLEQIETCDVVVGSRYVPGGKTDERWGWGRWFLSWWANSIYTRLILGCKVKDATAGFKCWRRETLLGMDLSRIRSQGYIFQVEMAYVAERLGYRVVEIPIYFEDRRIGQSKMSIPVKVEAALRVWEVRRRHRRLSPKDRVL